MFQVGEMIVYGGEGVCRVEAVGKVNLSGISGDRDFYTLVPRYRGGRIYIPVDSKVFMRRVISREEAERLIRSIPRISTTACSDRNLRALNEHYQTLLRTHDCADMVQVIKSAYEKGREKRSHGAKPGQVDEKYLKRAEELLYGELAVALDMPREQVPGYIARTIGEQE